MTPIRRRAFTLIETLVVIGVTGVLIGLLMSAVQAARGAANRAACANNLKQIALAAQLHHDARGTFPAAYDSLNGGPGSSSWPITNWPIRILPYIEPQSMWDQAEAAYRVTSDTNRNPPHAGRVVVVKVYTCPADGRLSAPITDDRGYTAAYGSYEGVGGGVSRAGGGYDGVMRALSGVRLAEITDGASNTLMIGEKPPWGRYLGGTWYQSVIDDPSLIDDPNWTGGSIGSMDVYSDGLLNNGCRGPFRFGPGRLDNRCDAEHFWSLHAGGANFAFADGSVHFLRYSADAIMPALATRAGGEAVTLPE
jgi:prepilin-type processing-associated H-X9-DG protein